MPACSKRPNEWLFSAATLDFFLCLFVFYVPSTARSFRDGTPHLLSLAKDVELGKYTVSTGNRTPGRRVAVQYATDAPRKLHCCHTGMPMLQMRHGIPPSHIIQTQDQSRSVAVLSV